MKKLSFIFAAVFAVIVSSNAFAGEPKFYNVTSDDIKNFAENFEQIGAQIDELEDSNIDIDNSENFADIIKSLENVKGLDKILADNGISGKNREAKFVIILFGAIIVTLEDQFEQNPAMVDQMKAQGQDPATVLTPYISQINEKDLKTLRSNKEILLAFAEKSLK